MCSGACQTVSGWHQSCRHIYQEWNLCQETLIAVHARSWWIWCRAYYWRWSDIFQSNATELIWISVQYFYVLVYSGLECIYQALDGFYALFICRELHFVHEVFFLAILCLVNNHLFFLSSPETMFMLPGVWLEPMQSTACVTSALFIDFQKMYHSAREQL